MHQYSFTTMNDKDFEALTCDLIGAHFKITIERFKSGKDKGVDGRVFANDGPDQIILQSKHYVGSGYDKMLSRLRD
jgi:Restriction endonuclease